MEDTLQHIICNLETIYILSKRLHWHTVSYAEHLLFDRVAEDVLGMADKIVETYFIPSNIFTIKTPAAVLPDQVSTMGLVNLICETLNEIDSVIGNKTTVGLDSLLGEIHNALSIKAGFVWLFSKSKDTWSFFWCLEQIGSDHLYNDIVNKLRKGEIK